MSEPNLSGIPDNTAGAIAYITFIPALVFLLLPPYNTNSYVRFHAWQSIFLTIAAFIISFALTFVLAFSVLFGAIFLLVITRIIWLGWILVWVLCAVNALNGKRFQLPIIGALAEQQANK